MLIRTNRPKKPKPPKYKRGDLVYSWQNKDYKAEVAFVSESDDAEYPHKYKVTLKDKDSNGKFTGYTHSSKWMNEGSLSKTKKKEY